MDKEEKALDDRYRKAARDMDAENKTARAELDATRKALARERGELASKIRNTVAEAEAASRKVCPPFHTYDTSVYVHGQSAVAMCVLLVLVYLRVFPSPLVLGWPV